MTLGLAIIARDEEQDLPRLLASVQGAFDEVVLLDTGSEDDTVGVFECWAHDERERHPGFGAVVGRFDWCDDFSAARTAADALLTTDWRCWADCDDEVRGADRLREFVARTPDGIAALVAGYDYAQDPQTGTCVCYLKRERVVRAGAGVWHGRVHEAQVLNAPIMELPPDQVLWLHRKSAERAGTSGGRNLAILEQWVVDEPDNPRVQGYLGRENMARGDLARAREHFEAYLKLRTTWDDERAQVHRHHAQCLMAQGEHAEAAWQALTAITVSPDWPDSYLTLAEASYARGEFAKAMAHAREALRRGQPDTLLIVNPLDYVFQPRLVLAGALGALGRTQEALDVAHEALAIMPGHGDLQAHAAGWRGALKRDQTAATWAGMYQLLVDHDEQLKARDVLACVPHYAENHPQVIAARADVRRRLAWLDHPDDYAEHYETGGSKPEDFVADEAVEAVGGALSRTAFALAGLCEQAGVPQPGTASGAWLPVEEGVAAGA